MMLRRERHKLLLLAKDPAGLAMVPGNCDTIGGVSSSKSSTPPAIG